MKCSDCNSQEGYFIHGWNKPRCSDCWDRFAQDSFTLRKDVNSLTSFSVNSPLGDWTRLGHGTFKKSTFTHY